MATTGSSGISFSGLFSNIDTDSMITKLMDLEKAPIKALEKKQAKLSYQKDDIMAMNTTLLTLKATIGNLTSSGTLFDNTVTSSDETILTGSATAAATTGSYNVEVLNLAKEQIVASATKLSTFVYGGGAGSFQIVTENGNGPTFTIGVASGGAGDTLSSLAAKINSATSGADNFSDYGVAQVITNPATGQQTLTIKTNETGTANKFKYKAVPGPNDVLQKLGMITYAPAVPNGPNELQAAVDATAKINGITTQSATNVLIDPITGVTLNLLAAEPGTTVKIDVGVSNTSITNNVKAFIEKFNEATAQINTYVKQRPIASPSTNEDLKIGDLYGDSDLISIKSGIRLKTTGYKDAALPTYKILSQIGIDSEASAGSFVSDKLVLNEAKLTSALADNKDEVITLLNGWADELDDYLDQQTKVSVIDSEAGNFYRRVLSIEDQISDIGDDIDSWSDRLQSMEDRMRTQFAAMESALQSMQSQSTYLTTQLNNLSKANSK